MMGSSAGRTPQLFSEQDDMESLLLDQAEAAGSSSSSSFRSPMAASAFDSALDFDPLSASLLNPNPAAEFRIDYDDYSDEDGDGEGEGEGVEGGLGGGVGEGEGVGVGEGEGHSALHPPPAYEDVVRGMPEESGGVGGGGNGRKGEGVREGREVLDVRVSDPQKVVEAAGSLVPGVGTYITYLVHTRTTLPEYSGREFSIRRRFRDFVTLADRLSEKYRGYFIPARPDKSVVESQVLLGRDFVQSRRLALHKYLRRLAAHPVIRRSEELRLFLETEGRLPLLPSTDMASRMLDGAVKLPRQLFGAESSLPPPQEAAQPAKGGRDLLRMFKELRQSVANDWGARPPQGEEDRSFQEKKEKLVDLEKRLAEASGKAEQLIKAQQGVGAVLGEVGMALIKLGRFEGSVKETTSSQKRHSTDCLALGEAAVVVHRRWKETIPKTTSNLLPLHEHLGSLQAASSAFSDRQQALVTLQTLAAARAAATLRAERLSAASQRVLGGDPARTRRAGELAEEADAAEAARAVAERELEKIKERNSEELERFEVERKRDFFKMVEGFVRNQEAFAEACAAGWSKAAEKLSPSGRRESQSSSLGS